ncbi:MAG: sensor domain-containing protein [Pseudomonadota bacterium]|nr:sensor domain-containing protein [Pseudomonadota bacterium]
MNAYQSELPTTIPAYLEHLRRALDGCDRALTQDALYDAEEYLRSEVAANPGKSEADVIAAVAGSYGAPDEVAEIYRDTEVKVQTALRAPPPRPRTSLAGRFFGVLADPHTYGSLFYMLLSLATGTFYFSWVVTGASLSIGLAILIIGIPFFILFVGGTRILALVEGRIVEVMLGERMPRRPLYSDRGQPWFERIKAMFTDARTWATMLYFLAMLPLGTIYFTLATVGLSMSLVLIALPFAVWLGVGEHVIIHGFDVFDPYAPWLWPLSILAGVLLLFATLHLARFIGRMHGRIAKQMLVSSQAY